MLAYAFRVLREKGFAKVATEEFDNIHDLLTKILLLGVTAQIKRGLYRDYFSYEEALSGLRGQINVTETTKQQTQIRCKLICTYDEFSANTPHNQILKCVMLILLRHNTVNSEFKKNLRDLLLSFESVSDIDPNTIRWDTLKYHRNNASYVMLIGICRLVIKGLLLTTETGSHKLAYWEQGEHMYWLYEKFVLFYYKRHYPEFSPRPSQIDWDIDDWGDQPQLPIMKSDIILTNGNRRLIIDTKWYKSTMQSRYEKKSFNTSHIYQIYSYVKNSDKEATGNVAGVVLYAKTDEDITPDADWVIGGNRISLKTLDLNQDWTAITDQLDKLCSWLKEDVCA